ncbi:hypothetical protein B0T25DRAFT_281867 [Lasiosphaeria hispida]|uniref:Uncharacterized protein n=1 Tax=Lasiosphaeria hispida TaxID=260671 RepID=A0AAJ0HBK3_9PEZI|nr:hypothetical protein B0T25DRAFT_281867 [Lasiosphaeria hispida]
MTFSLFKTTKTTPAPPAEGAASPDPLPPKKKSLYQRYWDAKNGRNKTISEADLLQYTGKTKAELDEWAKDRPGVGGNRAAGTLAMGTTTGLGGMSAAEGFGGWGPSAGDPKLKFPLPPKETAKKVDSEEDA